MLLRKIKNAPISRCIDAYNLLSLSLPGNSVHGNCSERIKQGILLIGSCLQAWVAHDFITMHHHGMQFMVIVQLFVDKSR